MKAALKKIGVYVVSGLGALGTALQNYVAVAQLASSLMSSTFAVTKAGVGIIQSIAIAFGGVCSGIVNFFVNVGLLEDFINRLFGEPDPEKPKPKLTPGQKFWLVLGSIVFIATGILFGLTALAFGSIGVMAAISVAAGIFVSAIMIIQELETWFQSFDDAKENAKSIKQIAKEWFASLTKEKLMGVVIAIGNVLALSLLFTFGLASFLISIVGVPAFPAVIAAFTVAFTGGAFTEFFFYNKFLSNFCGQLKKNWNEFWASKYSPLGLVTSSINAIVNGVLSYVGITAMTGLLVAAGIAVPPVGVVIAIAAVAAVFAGLASFVLCLDFWKSNSKRIPNLVCSTASSTAVIKGEMAKSQNAPVVELASHNMDMESVSQDTESVSSPQEEKPKFGVANTSLFSTSKSASNEKWAPHALASFSA
jgi:hypothetical protein